MQCGAYRYSVETLSREGDRPGRSASPAVRKKRSSIPWEWSVNRWYFSSNVDYTLETDSKQVP